MTTNMTSAKRFTIMLPGDDAAEPEGDHPIKNTPQNGLPHERFLLGEKVPAAPILLLGQTNLTVNPDEILACLQPVHLHATRDHLVLMGHNQVELSSEESGKLLEAALPLIEEDFQNPILFQGVLNWFIAAGPFASLASHSVDQAHGRNIDGGMPRDTHAEGVARNWRKLQNEIQMLWHIDPVNEIREQRGAPMINSIWISGIGKLNDVNTPASLKQAKTIYGEHPLLAGLSKFLGTPHLQELNLCNASDFINGFAWFNQPESIWPKLKQALIDKALDEIMIIDFPKGETRERTFKAKDLQKKSLLFWRKAEELSWKELTQS